MQAARSSGTKQEACRQAAPELLRPGIARTGRPAAALALSEGKDIDAATGEEIAPAAGLAGKDTAGHVFEYHRPAQSTGQGNAHIAFALASPAGRTGTQPPPRVPT